MCDCRQIDAHYFRTRGLQEHEEPVAKNRGKVDINTTVQVHQGSAFADNDVDFLFVDVFNIGDVQGNRFPFRRNVQRLGLPCSPSDLSPASMNVQLNDQSKLTIQFERIGLPVMRLRSVAI
jgi:hypothetical protein